MLERSSIIELGGTSPRANPFQGLMSRQRDMSLSDPAFESPLPLSAARGNPALLTSFAGLFHCSWPSLHVIALEGGAFTTELPRRRWLSLVFVVSGTVRIRQQTTSFHCAAGDCFFLPESPALWQSSDYNVVCLMFSPEQLREKLELLRYQDLDWQCAGDWNLSQPACRKASDGDVEAALLSTLHHLLSLTSELAMTHPILLTRLGISNQLCLLTAVLATPSFGQSLVSENNKSKNGGVVDSIEELADYIMNHLSEPLNLAVLERHSNYSRRSLQYAFRKKFGCTITQWIRSQRLDEARKRLLNGTSQDNVTSVANACGYRSVSLFSIEFQKRFHVKPSVLLRENQGKN